MFNISFFSKVAFEGTRGSGYQGDIAIDDVSFTDGACGGQSVGGNVDKYSFRVVAF